MKKLFVLLMLVAFLAAACAQTQVNTQPTAPSTGKSTPVTTPQEQQVESKCTFDEAATSSKAVLGTDLAAYPPYVKDVSVGDCATFGIVLGNYHSNLPKAVYAKLNFVRAYDANYNDPGADKEYMMSWIKTNFPQSFSLDANKFVTFPVDLVVGDKISPTKNTVPATYEFELVTYTYRSNAQIEYIAPFRLTLKTK